MPPQTEEWTFPKPKKTRKSRPPQHHPQRTIPEAPPSAIKTEYLKIRKDWSSSPCCTALRQVIATHAATLSPVKKAICLGLGTFDPHDGSWESKRRTYRQYIAFLIMVEELEKYTSTRIECIFQEPLFTDSERAFLKDMGHTVVDHPVACQSVTRDTLLYGIHLYRELYQEALDAALPAVFVGTGWDTWDELLLEDASLRGIKTMHERYQRFEFPEDGITFSNTCIYWRPGDQLGQKAEGNKDQDDGDGREIDLVDKLNRVAME